MSGEALLEIADALVASLSFPRRRESPLMGVNCFWRKDGFSMAKESSHPIHPLLFYRRQGRICLGFQMDLLQECLPGLAPGSPLMSAKENCSVFFTNFAIN